jgi:hypothetical protein
MEKDQVEERAREQLLERIERSWASLDALVAGLTESGRTTPGPDGWSVKDHLAHLAAWNLSLVALLEGRDRDAAIGVGGVSSETAANEVLQRRHRDLVADEVTALQLGSRQMVRDALARLRDVDLSRPYSYFQPNEARPDGAQPVLGWINGNTDQHADEHSGYIRELSLQVPSP